MPKIIRRKMETITEILKYTLAGMIGWFIVFCVFYTFATLRIILSTWKMTRDVTNKSRPGMFSKFSNDAEASEKSESIQ